MAASNKNSHLTLEDRRIIQKGIENGSSKQSIADTLGKDNSTIGKEIKNHRSLAYSSAYPIDCVLFPKCKNRDTYQCNSNCASYKKFTCNRRDRSPGACNGCTKYRGCRFTKYRYIAESSHHEYRELLVDSRIGINADKADIVALGNLIKPLLDKGHSLYAILQNHPEIKLSEKTLYNYIESGVFQEAGVSINCLDLKRQVKRRIPKSKRVAFNKRQDKSYLKGRQYSDYETFMKDNPYASVVEMDTVYNDVTNGPFIQTFKFLKYDLLICVYQEEKDSAHMLNGILLLEQMLGRKCFEKEVNVILTDRGSEFILTNEAELREDVSRRTCIFYCDAMASWQKGSLENVHLLLREICISGIDLYKLGFTSQEKANLVSSHINSYPKEKLNGKSSFQLLEFLNPDMAKQLYSSGLFPVAPDEVTLKPYLLKNTK